MSEEVSVMEVYARLKALRDNMPAYPSIESRYVEDFHQILGLLQKNTRFDLSRFKVSSNAVRPNNSMKTRIHYDRNFLMAKIEGLLNFFELQWSDPKPRIGFRPH
jgi:hypothetical protein